MLRPYHGGGLFREVKDGCSSTSSSGWAGYVTGGAFSHPVALAYRVERGEITGRVKDAAVAGNAYELCEAGWRFGNDARWRGLAGRRRCIRGSQRRPALTSSRDAFA